MKIRKLGCAFFLVFLGQSLIACVYTYPKDFNFSKLSLVEVGKSQEFRQKATKNLSSNGKLLFLRLDIATELDIWKLAKDKSYVLHVDSYFCARPDHKVMIGLNTLYWKNLNISEKLFFSDSPIQPDDSGKIIYSVLLDLDSQFTLGFTDSRSAGVSTQSDYRPFDLVEKPEDVCIQIRGRTMTGGVKSNVVKVPKELIQAELRKMDSLQGGSKRKLIQDIQ